MDRQEIEKKVKEIFSKKINVSKEKITLNSHLVNDLGLDSFSAIEIMFELEENFGINIPEKDFTDVKTLLDVVNYLTMRLAGDDRG